MLNPWVIVLIIAGMLTAVLAGKLTISAATAGGAVAGCCYLDSGLVGITMLGAFFLLATLATSLRNKEKLRDRLASEPSGKRDVYQVLANGSVAAAASAMGFLIPGYHPVFQLMAAASLSSAAADTVSSEIGNAYGSKFFNLLSFKADRKGPDGVISPEGTFAGLAASALIAAVYSLDAGWTAHSWYIVLSGTAGNIFDSVLGGTFERKGILNNNQVNFLNTLFAALIALMLFDCFG